MASDQDPQGQYQQPPQGQYPPPGRYPQHGPRPEKQDEKEQEKRREKGQGMDEKYHRNPLGFVDFGLLIIWLGITLLLQNTDVIKSDSHVWGMFFWGWGVLVLAEVVVRIAVPRFRRSLVGPIIWGAILVMVGFGLWFDSWKFVWPIAVIAVGVSILVNRVVPRR